MSEDLSQNLHSPKTELLFIGHEHNKRRFLFRFRDGSILDYWIAYDIADKAADEIASAIFKEWVKRKERELKKFRKGIE